MLKGDVLSFDCETTGLGWRDRPFGISASNGTDTIYLDERTHSKKEIGSLIETLNKAPVLIAQNAKFDLHKLETWGLKPQGEVHDTEVLGRLVNNSHLSYSLDAQTKRYGLHKDDEVAKYVKKNKIENWFDVPLNIMAPYAAQDALGTYQLYYKLLPELDPRSTNVWRNEIALTKVCADIEKLGMALDLDYVRQAKEYEESLVREAKSHFLMATGKQYDNTKSTLVEVFKAAGENIPKTSKGNDSFTYDILETFTSPAAKFVQKIRFHEKRISTYYDNFINLSVDGIIHADIRQAGTTSGRFSYRDPNLQNLSKEEDSTDKYLIRGCFKPRPGNVFVAMDYKQQEYRLMLAYANHMRLVREVMGGADVHQATADLVGITRKKAKTLNFAILYGAGIEKLALMLGISIAEAAQLKKQYFMALLEVENLIHKVITTGRGRGYVYNWMGRKLQVNSKEFAYKLPNYLIQGGGADICKLAMVNCHKYLSGTDAAIVLQIHDALVFEMPENKVNTYAPDLKQIMIDAFPAMNGMMMDVDVTVSNKSLAERDMVKWER